MDGTGLAPIEGILAEGIPVPLSATSNIIRSFLSITLTSTIPTESALDAKNIWPFFSNMYSMAFSSRQGRHATISLKICCSNPSLRVPANIFSFTKICQFRDSSKDLLLTSINRSRRNNRLLARGALFPSDSETGLLTDGRFRVRFLSISVTDRLTRGLTPLGYSVKTGSFLTSRDVASNNSRTPSITFKN